MRIKELSKEIYVKLMNYIFQRCDVISLTVYADQNKDVTQEVLSVILESSNYSEQDIIDKYSKDFLNEMYNQYKDNNFIFDEVYQRKYEQIGSYSDYLSFCEK